MALALATLTSNAAIGAPVPPGHGIEIERGINQNQEQNRSSLIPNPALDLDEFNDFNYSLRPYQEPIEVPDLIDIEAEVPRSVQKNKIQLQQPNAQDVHTTGEPQQRSIRDSPKKSNSGAVTIIGVSPELEVSNPKEITISFSKNMTELGTTSPSNSNIIQPPITISPRINGTWRWFSPRVLVFTPTSGTFPRSTEFTVTIAKSLGADDGTKLAEGKTWKFSTEHPVLVPVSGGFDQLGLSVLFEFKQPIKVASALSKIHMVIDEKEIPLRQATKKEADLLVGSFMDREGAYCFVPANPLPPDKEGKVTIEEGIEAAEGPLRSTNSSEKEIHTASAALKCTSAPQLATTIGTPWLLSFSGPIDTKTGATLDVSKMTKEMFSISPPLPNQKITAAHDTVVVRGNPIANQEYTLKIAADLPGINCTLGTELERKLIAANTQPAEILPLSSIGFVVTPTGPTNLTIYSKGTDVVIASIFDIGTVYGKDCVPTGDPPPDIDKKVPLWQKKLQCSPYRDDVKVSNLDLEFLRKNKTKQFVLYLNPPQQEFSVEGVPVRTSINASNDKRKASLNKEVAKNSSFEKVRGPGMTWAWIQFVSMNATCLTSESSTALVCTSLSDGHIVDALSASALPEKPFTKTGTGQFSLPISLHVQEHSALKVTTQNGTMMLPNLMRMSHREHEGYIAPKFSVFCTGDFEHAGSSQPLKFAGFLNAINSAGEMYAAPDGAVTFVAVDSDGSTLNSGSTKLQNGFFAGAITIPLHAKTGVGKIAFSYTKSSDDSPFNFGTEFNIHSASIEEETNGSKCEPAVSSYGLSPNGELEISTRFPQFDDLLSKPQVGLYVGAAYARFRPQGWNDFKFGHCRSRNYREQTKEVVWSEGTTTPDGQGTARFKYSNISSTPLTLNLYCSRLDSPDRIQRDDHSFTVQPADLLIGVKTQSDTDNGNTTIDVETIATNLSGDAASDKSVEIKVFRDAHAKHAWDNPELASISFVSGTKPIKHRLKVSCESDLILIAMVKDDQQRASRTILDISSVVSTTTPANAAPLAVSTNKNVYHSGELCKLNFARPFESSNGFVAIAASDKVATFPIKNQSLATAVSFKIPENSNGEYTGIVKIFESKPVEKTSREAEGEFHILIEPKFQKLRLRLKCNDLNDTRKRASLQVTDENGLPVQNANVILAGEHDCENVECKDENFQLQMVNPCRTTLFASSLSRAPIISDVTNMRNPISTFPAEVSTEKFVNRTFKNLPEYPSGAKIFPLQTLQTDANGVATFEFVSTNIIGNARIYAYVMTQSGNGFESTSLMLPADRSKPVESDREISPRSQKSLESSETKLSTKFENFELFDSDIVNLKEQKKMLSNIAPNTTPLSIAISNSRLTPLAVSAERMLAQNPLTSDLRAARLLTLLSLFPFIEDVSTQKRFTSAINEDVRVVSNLDDAYLPIHASWIPVNLRGDYWRELESPYTAALLAEALLLAKQRGYFEWKSLAGFPIHLLVGNVYHYNYIDANQSQFFETTKSSAFGIYVASKMKNYVLYPPLSVAFNLQSIEQKMSELPPETLAWLVVCRNDLGFHKPTVEVLEQSFLKSVAAELSTSVKADKDGSKLRRLSSMLTGLLRFNPQSELIEDLANAIDRALNSPEYKYKDVERSFAAVALCDYYDHRPTAAQAGIAKIEFKRGSPVTFDFRRDTPAISVLEVEPSAGNPVLSGSTNLSWGAVYCPANSAYGARNSGIAIKRTFRSADAGLDKCFVDEKGVWHCKANSPITEHIEFIPINTIKNLVLSEKMSTSAKVETTHFPVTTGYSPQYKGNNYRETWPQKIIQSSSKIAVYGSDLQPGKYVFDYQVNFRTPGTFKLPGVTAQSAYENALYGVSEAQTVIVTP